MLHPLAQVCIRGATIGMPISPSSQPHTLCDGTWSDTCQGICCVAAAVGMLMLRHGGQLMPLRGIVPHINVVTVCMVHG